MTTTYGDVIKCQNCGKQSRSISRGCSNCGWRSTKSMNLPDGTYIAIDADCPGCHYPERRARFDEHGAVFSCRKCSYISRKRDA